MEYARAGYTTTGTMPQIPVAPPAPKKSLLRYLIPAAGVVVAVILFVIFNPFNFQLSTQKSSASSSKSSLAVLYFENIPDPEDKDHTGEMLTNLLTTSLFQTRDVEVISRERLYDIQKELGQADAKAISPSMATKVAERAGVTMMLLGSILQRQPELAVTYRLVEVQSGKILSTQRLSGFTADKIFALVDTLALLVKNDLNVTPSASAGAASVASVTTSSPEAYRSYLEGVQLNGKYFCTEAKAAYNRAIELDSNFAMAYFGLATLAVELDAEMQRASLVKAWRLSDRTTEKERLNIQSVYALRVANEPVKGVALMEELLEKYPHEQSVYSSLINVYRRQNKFEKAIQTATKGLQNDPRDGEMWNGLGYVYAIDGRRNEAIAAIDRYQQIAPALPNAYDSKGEMYAMFGERDSAYFYYQKAVSFKADFPSIAKLGGIALSRGDYTGAETFFRRFGETSDKMTAAQAKNLIAWIPIWRGRLQEAELLLRRNLESFQAQRLTTAVSGIYYEFVLLAYLRQDYAGMVEYAEKYSTLSGEEANYFARGIRALAHLKNGNAEMYARILDEMGKNLPDVAPRRRALVELTAATGSFEQGKYEEALQRYTKAKQWLAPNHLPPLWVGIAQVKTGHPREAVEALSKLSRWVAVDVEEHTLTYIPQLEEAAPLRARYWLGVAHEKLGEKDAAVKEYEAFLEFWKDADFKSGEITDAKTRLAALRKVASK
jgi:tetratricopeptide (TPR) repeat protein/TolB-like protein